MLNVLFSSLMVGIPALAGCHMITARTRPENLSIGVIIVVYAAILALLFAVLIPEGKLLAANFKLKMPGAFFLGCAIGLITGVLKRRDANR